MTVSAGYANCPPEDFLYSLYSNHGCLQTWTHPKKINLLSTITWPHNWDIKTLNQIRAMDAYKYE